MISNKKHQQRVNELNWKIEEERLRTVEWRNLAERREFAREALDARALSYAKEIDELKEKLAKTEARAEYSAMLDAKSTALAHANGNLEEAKRITKWLEATPKAKPKTEPETITFKFADVDITVAVDDYPRFMHVLHGVNFPRIASRDWLLSYD